MSELIQKCKKAVRKTITVRMDREQVESVKVFAQKNGVRFSDVVRHGVDALLARELPNGVKK